MATIAPPTAVAVSAGGSHSCAVTSAGAAKCWGDNRDGQLGNGTRISSTTPVNVSGLASGVVAIGAGYRHSCALTSAGAVKCWGYNWYGQLGDGSNTDSSVPVNVVGLNSGVAAIAVGTNHTCAVTTSGAAKCWGFNYFGMLGGSDQIIVNHPIDVVGLGSGVAAITAASWHTCALTTAGAVKCWGWNDEGQLGDGTNDTSGVPVDVVGLDSGVAAISAKGSWGHTCALTDSGGVKCWGRNFEGELGDGTTTDSNVPVDVSGLSSGVASISVGGWSTCAATSSGAAKCWGGASKVPATVTGLSSGVAAITGGTYHACALMETGGIKCWGRNVEGELGDGTTTFNRSTPVDVVWFGIEVTVTGPVVPGLPFTVDARVTDGNGQTLAGYDASATWYDLGGSLMPAAPSGFVNGTSTTTATITQPVPADRVVMKSGGIAAGQSDILLGPIAVRVSTPVYTGHPFTITAFALDVSGHRVPTYNGPATWSDRSGQLAPATPSSFVNGVSSTGATIPAPFHANKVTISSGGSSGTSGPFAVIGPLAAIRTTVVRPVTAGSPFTVVGYATDAASNLVKNYNAPASWGELSGQISPGAPSAFVNGVSRSTPTISVPYHRDQITIESGGVSHQTGTFDVLGPLSAISVTVPSPVTHGVAFNVRAVARDAVGNWLRTYNDAATWSALSGDLSPTTPESFVNGLSTTTTTTVAAPFSADQITVTSGGVSGQSNLFNVL